MKDLLFAHIDLTDRNVVLEHVEQSLLHKYLGGRGIATALSAERIPEGCNPLGKENVLTICTGLLTGSGLPAAARTHFCALSPLTGLLGSSNAGGYFGTTLRKSGIMGLTIVGKSETPVYLHINSRTISICPAEELWGSDTDKCEKLLNQYHPGTRKLCIGPAGENMSAMASIVHDTHSAAGRTGMGAVMGAKKLKAIVVEDLRRTGKGVSTSLGPLKTAYLKSLRSHEMFNVVSQHGQSGYIGWCNNMGMLSTRNYQQGTFQGAEAICGSEFGGRLKKHKACASCPIRCKADSEAKGNHKGKTGPRPEFESIASLGSKCGQGDPDDVLSLSYLCGRLGLDTISAGSVIAFAMELHEKGILTREDTGGLDLFWGDYDVQEKLLHSIARREGLGDILADGVRKAAERIGRGSDEFAMHVKGLELCAYDPRGTMGTALGYAISGRGGDFASVFQTAEYRWTEEQGEAVYGSKKSVDRFSPICKGMMVRQSSLCAAVVDAIGICKVAALGIPAAFDLIAESALIQGYLGEKVNAEDLFLVGERIVNLERLFNIRFCGSGGMEDSLPGRFLNEVLNDGPASGHRIELERMVKEYYAGMGWDESGHPTTEKLSELGLC